MGATTPYATSQNLAFILPNCSFLAVLLGGQDFVHALLNVAVLP